MKSALKNNILIKNSDNNHFKKRIKEPTAVVLPGYRRRPALASKITTNRDNYYRDTP